jgi:putative PIN family toxin of toxin-antitoxin system
VHVFSRGKFDRYADPDRRMSFLATYLALCEHVAIDCSIQACRDPKDDKYLELAVSGGADVIVTGDAGLRSLHPFRGIALLSPAEFLATATAA